MYGAQCKLKEPWKSLDENEIRGEVETPKTFPSKLDHYAFVTKWGKTNWLRKENRICAGTHVNERARNGIRPPQVLPKVGSGLRPVSTSGQRVTRSE